MARRNPSSKTYRAPLIETLETSQSNRVESGVLIDLRSESRFDTNIPCDAFTEEGLHACLTVIDVSTSGLRLEGDGQTVGALLGHLSSSVPRNNNDNLLEVHFSVPTGADSRLPVKVRCRIVCVTHAGEDTYQIGTTFLSYESGRAGFAEYLWSRASESSKEDRDHRQLDRS